MKHLKFSIRPNRRGDTIVEVLIAITIASFVMGISYATAQRSLQQAITAGEHNEALNLIEQQITDLQLRYQNTPAANYETTFGAPNTHYCLDNFSTGPGDPIHQWRPFFNYNNSTSVSNNLVSGTTPSSSAPYYYNATNQNGCEQVIPSVGATYFTDITTSPSGASKSPTLYHVVIRWYRLGSGEVNQANLYFKLDGGQSQPLGYRRVNGPVAVTAEEKAEV